MVCTEVTRDTFRLPHRPRDAHKGDFGRVCVVGGSVGLTGAPVLASGAAVRCGAGLVSLGVPQSIWAVTAVRCLEAMPFPLPDDENALTARLAACDAILLGPGLGSAPETAALVRRLAARLELPLVLDADGLNAFAGQPEALSGRRAPLILTPHEGEFARLTGDPLPLSDRAEAACAFAEKYGCTLVLKGRRTVTAAPDGRVWINTTGNPGMAKGGSGDVLAGMILALIGQGLPAAEGAAMAVWLHGRAGDLAAEELGEYGMTPGDLLAFLPRALKELED